MSQNNRYQAKEINGIFLLNKALGVSSNRALQQVKHLFQAKKAGHTGSLDPLATGMLPICFGEATKFSHFLLDADKSYLTTAKLGAATTTGDVEGEVILQHDIPILNQELIDSTLQKFIGPIEQIPPMYSALKHQGKPLYELARQGIEIERKKRLIMIYEIKLLEFSVDSLLLQVHCSKGTYIRTLVEDIAVALGTVAHVAKLHRQWVAPFQDFPMVSFEELAQCSAEERSESEGKLLPIDAALQIYPAIALDEAQVIALQQGKTLDIPELPQADYLRLINSDNQFMGMGQTNKEGQLVVKRLLRTN